LGTEEVGSEIAGSSVAAERHNHLGAIALVVRDYDEARTWYVEKLGFDMVEDTPLGGGKRWVLVAPPGAPETRLLLAKAVTPEQRSRPRLPFPQHQ
jgi:catechol 2,3-dioxygenase-like lactoylglutathione lyase family enzyme